MMCDVVDGDVLVVDGDILVVDGGVLVVDGGVLVVDGDIILLEVYGDVRAETNASNLTENRNKETKVSLTRSTTAQHRRLSHGADKSLESPLTRQLGASVPGLPVPCVM
ncbi:hypothetical protein RRG08_019027 [Elysia crispata]|uniref:Uncharacterized protein n=1 Tax=Elysia crispata TaxID=231223 RepID=A0AAE1A676_9GAST|nr:hypothetical protein RRG08_019027 [Elysia crispata]